MTEDNMSAGDMRRRLHDALDREFDLSEEVRRLRQKIAEMEATIAELEVNQRRRKVKAKYPENPEGKPYVEDRS